VINSFGNIDGSILRFASILDKGDSDTKVKQIVHILKVIRKIEKEEEPQETQQVNTYKE
jgi:predicted transcriptional regulator